MSSSKTLLLATAVATILSLPAFASDAPPASFDGTAGTNAMKAAPGEMPADGAAPTTMDPTSSPPTAIAAPAPGTPAADAPPADVTAPATATVPPTMSADPVAPMDAAAPASEDDMAAPDAAPVPATPAPAETAAPAAMPDEPTPATDTAMPATAPTEAAPAEAAPAPVAEPAPKKVTKPAKLSALAKKYDLLGLDTNGDKALSKSEFTANGYANAKLFARYDFDHNGKLTNAEMNAYASNIEANIKK